MFSKVIAELILLTLMIFPHGTDKGRFEIMNESGEKVQVSFTRADITKSIVEGMHEYTVTVHSAKPEVLKYIFIDNGLYLTYTDNPDNGYELDILPFLMNLNRDKILGEQQVFNTSSVKDKLISQPSDDNITMTLKKNKTKTIIDRKYLNPVK